MKKISKKKKVHEGPDAMRLFYQRMPYQNINLADLHINKGDLSAPKAKSLKSKNS